MSLEELWELFPISLVEHDDMWEASYRSMEARLRELLADFPNVRISHIGSTAIPEIQAKNIVDVLVEIPEDCDFADAVHAIEDGGLTRMRSEGRRVSFNLGYTPDGFAEEVFHVHLRYAGDNDELYFRDYLQDYPQVAKEYETLKMSLAKQFEHNRDAYTDAKSDFIRKWTDIAKAEYDGRYSCSISKRGLELIENKQDLAALREAIAEDDGIRYSQVDVIKQLGI